MDHEKLSAPFPEEMEETKGETEKFSAEETVNGHRIICAFYPFGVGKNGNYEISFPQIDYTSAKAKKDGVNDQNVIISEDEDDAKFVFNKVKKWAEEENDLHKLYKKVKKLTQTLD